MGWRRGYKLWRKIYNFVRANILNCWLLNPSMSTTTKLPSFTIPNTTTSTPCGRFFEHSSSVSTNCLFKILIWSWRLKKETSKIAVFLLKLRSWRKISSGWTSSIRIISLKSEKSSFLRCMKSVMRMKAIILTIRVKPRDTGAHQNPTRQPIKWTINKGKFYWRKLMNSTKIITNWLLTWTSQEKNVE